MISQPSPAQSSDSTLATCPVPEIFDTTEEEPADLSYTRSSEPLPEGGYGWVCVAATFLINAHTWGINSAYGVVLAFYLSDHTFSDTTPLDYAFVGGLSIACAMLISPVATYLVHHYGIHASLCLGTILETLSLITTSFVHNSWQLFLSEGICFGLGMGFCFVGSIGVVSHWFERRRSLVNGITAAGSGIGGLIYSLATSSMISRLGFPWAMRILGIICFVINLPCGCLLRYPSTSTKHHSSSVMHFDVLRNVRYAFFLAWGILSGLGYIALLFSLSSYAKAVGLTQHQASIASAILNLGQAFGRPVIGILSDKLGRINVAFGASLFAGVLCLTLWVFAKSMAVILVFAIIVGLVSGTLWAAAAPLAAEIVGLKSMASSLGIFWLALGPPTAVAEAIAVQLRDGVGDKYPYLRVQMFTGAMYVGAALCIIMVKVLPSRNDQTSRGRRKQDYS